jgi:hypothetical protein
MESGLHREGSRCIGVGRCEKLGFIGDRQIGKHRWVMTRVVEPRDDAGGSVS